MGDHHLPGERQADTRATFSRGEERHKDLGRDLVRNTVAIVPDLDHRVAAPVEAPAQLDSGAVGAFGGLPGIAQQVQEHGLQQVAIGNNIEPGGFDL